MQGRARLGEFGLRLELMWNTSQYGPLEAKVPMGLGSFLASE